MGKKAGTELVAFRLEPELLKQLDDYAKRLQADNPGLRATRADALRVLLSKALAAEGKTQTSKR
jgi:hypothetical protein